MSRNRIESGVPRGLFSHPRGRRVFAAMLLLPCLFGGAAYAQQLAAAEAWKGTARLDEMVRESVEDGTIPGAVLLVSHNGELLYRKAFGFRSLVPKKEPMTLDTIFDCASLTKVVATTTSVMLLLEEGRFRLSEPINKYLPRFGGGESPITIQQLMTHYSGLRPDVDLEPEWAGHETGIEKAYLEKPIAPPGSRFIYSDINYILLGELVRAVSGKRIDEFAAERVFAPLGMTETAFNPAADLIPRIAPTERLKNGTILRGVVHDPTTRFMEGVAGHAGMFSTVDDLRRFAGMLLNGGKLGDRRLLSPLAVLKMTTPQSPAGEPAERGLGWDVASPFASPRGDLLPYGSFGHTGYTGTSMWLDPETKTFVILLTNRVHPEVRTSVVSLRSRVATVVAAALDDVDIERLRYWEKRADPTGGEGSPAGGAPRPEKSVLTGLDVLVRDEFAEFRGKRIGLVTNQTGIDRDGRRNIDLFAKAPGVDLKRIFSPEHGIQGRSDQEDVGDSVDEATGVPVVSLYQPERRRPTAAMLGGLDAIVFDIQDIGARFYTYMTTMAYAMEEAAKQKMPFYVLDRPNPINGLAVEGPMLDAGMESFVGYFPMPARHGMTMAEMARLFNAERGLNANLKVIKMEGWQRRDWFDGTGLPWVNPSPNMRTLNQALLYPGIAMLEGLSNYSVGRGTDTPFEFIGADWIDGLELARALNEAAIGGLRFYAVSRTPTESRFAGKTIQGVQIAITDREAVSPTRAGLEVAATLLRLYPQRVKLAETERLIGSLETIRKLTERKPVDEIWGDWERAMRKFLAARERALIY